MSREIRTLSFRGLRVSFSIVRPEAHMRHRLLLLWSPLMTGFHWRKLLPELSELGCLCVLADLPGFGQAAQGAAFPRECATRARMVWGVLDDVDARVGGHNALWHLAAHGAACSTALAMAAEQPDSVRSLIQISPLFCGEGVFSRRDEAERMVSRALSGPRALSSFIAHAARKPLPDYSVERIWASFARPGARSMLVDLLSARDAAPGAPGFCPSIAVWGGSDPLMHAQTREHLRALIPEIEAHVIRTAGHFPMETHSRALRDYLRGWLRYVG